MIFGLLLKYLERGPMKVEMRLQYKHVQNILSPAASLRYVQLISSYVKLKSLTNSKKFEQDMNKFLNNMNNI